MATETSASGVIKAGAVAVAEVTGFTLTQTGDTVEDTVIGDAWRSHKATLKSYTASVDCFYDQTDTTGQGAFAVGAEVSFSLYPSGDDSVDDAGDIYYTGSGIVTGRTITSSVGEMITMTLEIQGNGALTESAVSA